MMKTHRETEAFANTTTGRADDGAPPPGNATRADSQRRALLFAGIVVALAAAVVVAFVLRDDGSSEGQIADVLGQGGEGDILAADAATLLRAVDGLGAEVEVPRPEPGSYEYPAADNLGPGAAPHPAVSAGASDAPEAFTLWMFIFNRPERCTDAVCDGDDLGPDADALGGVFQVDGRIADEATLRFSGRVRTGQVAGNGVVLEQPLDAEVHLAIAPHGRFLPGEDGWRQLNGPLANPTFWWAATFLPE